jgi:hypothetical protein
MKIHQLLKARHANGEQRAMRTKEIVAITGMTQREVTKAVQREREKHFICATMSNGGGYYRPVHISEIEHYKNVQEKRIAMHAISLRLARRFIRKRNSNLQ